MERRKAEVQLQVKRIQEECASIKDSLNKLSKTCSTQLDTLEMISSADFRLQSQYFLAVIQYQYESYQKLLEINIDLEEHIEIKQSPTLEQFLTGCMLPSQAPQEDVQSEKTFTKSAILTSENEEYINASGNDIIHSVSDTVVLKTKLNDVHVDVNTQNNEINKTENIPSISKHQANDVHTMANNCSDQIENLTTKPIVLKTEPNNICRNNKYNEANTCMPKTKQSNHVSHEKCNNVNLSKPTTLNIIDKLKKLSQGSEKKKTVVKPIPGIALQNVKKKMDVVIKENSTKMPEIKSKLPDVGPSSSQEYNAPQYEEVVNVRERVDPQVNEYCMISHIESPSYFYIQVADENAIFLDLFTIQQESLPYQTCTNLTKLEASQKLGNFCCVKLDRQWYRVEVIDWMLEDSLHQELVTFQLIDYGNTFKESYKILCPVMKEILNIPRIAQLCHLDGLYPPGSTYNNELSKWPGRSKDGFLNICGDIHSNLFEIIHVVKDTNKNSFAIDLIQVCEDNNQDNNEYSIGQILCDSKLAVEILDEPIIGCSTMINQILTSHGLHNTTPEMTRDEILELYFTENNMKEARNINEAVMDYNPRDEALTCKNLRRDGTCYKGDQCKLRHAPLKDGFTRDKHPVYYRAFVDLTLPFVGDEVYLTITHINDIQCFYAQLRQISNKDIDCPTITSLILDMNNPDTVKNYKTLSHTPGLGQLVIVKHWNNYWYRGQVRKVDIPENNDYVVIDVFVVDFGDLLPVPMSDLRTMLHEFLTIPFQAIECRLYNVEHKPGIDEIEEKKHFESTYLGQTLKAKIIAIPGHLQVLLYTDNNEDIGEKMIANGYGKEKIEHNIPKDNEIFLID